MILVVLPCGFFVSTARLLHFIPTRAKTQLLNEPASHEVIDEERNDTLFVLVLFLRIQSLSPDSKLSALASLCVFICGFGRVYSRNVWSSLERLARNWMYVCWIG